MAEPQANYDWSQYANWEKFVTRAGQVVYKVPGTMFLYDPFLSSQKGKPVVFVDERYKKEDQLKAEKALKEQSSPLNQAIPVVAGTAGIIGSKYAIDALGPTSAAEKFAEAQLANQATQQVAQQAPQAVANTAPAAESFANSAMSQAPATSSTGAYQIGTNVDGSALMSDGSTLAADGTGSVATLGNAFSTLASLKGAYDTAKSLDNGGEGIRGATTTLGAGLGSFAGPLGTVAGAAAGNLVGYGLQGDGLKNRAALGFMTGGLSEVARAAGFSPVRKTTQQFQQEKTSDLLKQAGDDTQAQSYISAMRNQTPGEKAYAGKYNSWDEYKKAGLEAGDLTGVYGNLKTFGKDWTKLSFDQQKAVTQGLINADLYKSNKGDIEVTNEEEARKIKDQILGAVAAPAALQAQRTGTLSAGIGKDGKPISYSKGQTLTEQQGKELARRADARWSR